MWEEGKGLEVGGGGGGGELGGNPQINKQPVFVITDGPQDGNLLILLILFHTIW